jgi:hypothetical protein
MTFDTEWPAAAPIRGRDCKGITAERLGWCIRYLAEEARRGGFPETAEALEAIIPAEDAERVCGLAASKP